MAGILLTAFYFSFRHNTGVVTFVAEKITRPYHSLAGRVCAYVNFSVAELFYVAAITVSVIYLIIQIARILRKDNKKEIILKTALTFLSLAAAFYGGFCLLWGFYYQYSDGMDFCDLQESPISVEELSGVCLYFADKANELGTQVNRDENQLFTTDREYILSLSHSLYENLAEIYPALQGASLRAKGVIHSRFMSRINFTGFFFPFTGEANVNTDSPVCLFPATIAHEIAHQRGIAREDWANFVAVIACMESPYTEYRYSAALLAYIHLSNALYKADYNRWLEIRNRLSESVLCDLTANTAYWTRYSSGGAAKISETIYDDFLKGYGEARGRQSYGACVDLLVNYYYPLCDFPAEPAQ